MHATPPDIGTLPLNMHATPPDIGTQTLDMHTLPLSKDEHLS